MSTEVSLFYNQEACKDVLILIADESSYPDKVEKYEDVIILKNKDRVRIVTDDLSFGPRKDWIDKAHTSLAKKKIREFNKK